MEETEATHMPLYLTQHLGSDMDSEFCIQHCGSLYVDSLLSHTGLIFFCWRMREKRYSNGGHLLHFFSTFTDESEEDGEEEVEKDFDNDDPENKEEVGI